MAETDATGGRGELEMPPQALAALQQGRKIEAIRLVRAAHGSELRQAKGFVERFIAADPHCARARCSSRPGSSCAWRRRSRWR